MSIQKNQYAFTISILSISIVYTFFVSSNYYGFGIDYWGVYQFANVNFYSFRDWLGFRIVTFTLWGIHFGVEIVTFMISISSGLLIKNIFKLKSLNSLIILCFIFILVLHTWPIVMSNSNVMRQGLCMSLIFLALSAQINRRFVIALLLMVASTFIHRVGLSFLIIFLFYIFTMEIIRLTKSDKIKIIFIFFIGLLLSSLIYVTLLKTQNFELDHTAIGGDYTLYFFIINLLIIIIYTFRWKTTLNYPINIFIYFFSFSGFPMFLLNLNWQYERYNMIMTIPLILCTGLIFTRRSSYIYWILIFSLLCFLTIYTGMFRDLSQIDSYRN